MADSYQQLEIYEKSLELFFKTHKLSLQLPKYETYELGSQLRRSSDSINTNIVEGYGRKRYKADFLKFLVYAHSSCDETKNHLRKIEFLYPALSSPLDNLKQDYDILGAKIYNFIKYVEKSWKV
ncbi:four helix bundle protein [Salegentibacter sp. HM20]